MQLHCFSSDVFGCKFQGEQRVEVGPSNRTLMISPWSNLPLNIDSH